MSESSSPMPPSTCGTGLCGGYRHWHGVLYDVLPDDGETAGDQTQSI